MIDDILLPGQKAWIADPSPLKVCDKGRRTGITWAEASDDVLIAASRRGVGSNVYYFPQAKEDAIEYVEACGKWAKAFQHVASSVHEGTWEDELGVVLPPGDPDKNILTYRIEFDSGYRIVALSSAPARARGKQGVFVLDEAAFHPNLPGVLKAVLATFLRGGRVRAISTHNGEDNPFNELITEIRSGRRLGTVHHYPFAQAIREGMFKRICELQPELWGEWSPEKESKYVADAYRLYSEDAAEELDAVPSSGSGVFLSSVLIERCMAEAPILRYECDDAFAGRSDADRWSQTQAWIEDYLLPCVNALNQHLTHCFGEDFGRSGHLSVFAPMEIGADLTRRVPFLIELRNVPFEQQKQILFYTVERLPGRGAGALDARGNGQYLAEVTAQKFGASRIEQVMLSTEWYRANMPPFKAAFEDKTLLVPKHADVRTDLRAIKMDRGIAKIPITWRRAAAMASSGTGMRQSLSCSAITPPCAMWSRWNTNLPAGERWRRLGALRPELTETGFGTVGGRQ